MSQNKLDYNCLGCAIIEIKDQLEKKPPEYRKKITEILFVASKNHYGVPNVIKFLGEMEAMLMNNAEDWEIRAKIEMAEIVLDKKVSDCYYENDKHRFLRGINKKTTLRTLQGERSRARKRDEIE